MKTTLLFIFSVLASFVLYAKDESPKQFHVEYKVNSIRWQNDSATAIKNGVIKADFTQLSEILPLYKTGKMKYGIQFEVYESKLNNETRYFISIAYYYREDSEWNLIYIHDANQFTLPHSNTTESVLMGENSIWTSDFGIKYLFQVEAR
jgi:hypothetical protein